MTPTRYFSLRSKLDKPPSTLPAVILGALTLLTIVGLFIDIARAAV